MKNSNYNTNKAWSPRPEKTTRGSRSTASIFEDACRMNKPSFMNALSETRESIYNPNISITENGAVGYKTTDSALLDLNFAVASLRGADNKKIVDMFRKAFNENPIWAMRWLFYCRDAREGLGERNLFRVCLVDLAWNGMAEKVNNLMPVIAEYGRFDDMWELLEVPACRRAVVAVIKAQKAMDDANYLSNKPVSLLAKWLPSENASSVTTRHRATMICSGLHMTPKAYRQYLTRMRKYIDVVERKMSSNNWQAIDYEAVPSKANLIYKNAFLKHDTDRRRAFLGALTNGEAKINSSVNYPHDIVHKYTQDGSYWSNPLNPIDATLEGLWKALPDTVQGCGNTMVVADGSGSMTSTVGNTKVTALEVANALAIYFAERSSGEFKNKYVTFSMTPQFVDFSKAHSLHDKLQIALQHNECANTNVEAVFDLILTTAINNGMSQKDIPQNILIISDMEFDGCAYSSKVSRSRWGYDGPRVDATLFDTIKKRYANAGLLMPKLIFWNVNSRTNTIPMKENDLGVVLVSGFSVNICKMVMSNKTDPYECLIETIMNPRYDVVEKLIVS